VTWRLLPQRLLLLLLRLVGMWRQKRLSGVLLLQGVFYECDDGVGVLEDCGAVW
jgi:hypothetical protein